MVIRALLVLALVGATIAETREYYIAAEYDDWNYGPGVTKGSTWLEQSSTLGAERIGGTYKKARYFGYTDGSFTSRLPEYSDWTHLHVLGPLMRAEVGDTLVVTLVNRLSGDFPVTLHTHLVKYDKESEGVKPHVLPGENKTYTWEVTERSGPSAKDTSSLLVLYHSHARTRSDIMAGLVGPIIITKKDAATSSSELRPSDVDREFVTVFINWNENISPLLGESMSTYIPGSTVSMTDPDFVESNTMRAINGRMFNSIGPDNLKSNVGEKVRWYVAAMGDEEDIHTPHWHAHTVLESGHRTDVLSLLPSTFVQVDMQPDNPGTWNFHCHVNSHNAAGMNAKYLVEGPVTLPAVSRVRQYYVAAEMVEWDYAPTNNPNNLYTEGPSVVPARIGSKYQKVVYKQYTDDNFDTLVPVPDAEKHKGIMGPILRAKVGEQIRILFKNKADTGFCYSMHPHGVFYEPTSEGVGLPAGGICYNETWVYEWSVPGRAGPAGSDFSSVFWHYHSHIQASKDLNDGLVGGIVITTDEFDKDDDGIPDDVDAEAFTLFLIFDENSGHFLNENVQTYIGQSVDTSDSDFVLSNKKYSINGYIFNNVPEFKFNTGDHVRWYVNAMGDQQDIHTVHWHAHAGVNQDGLRSDVEGLLPAQMRIADMVMDNEGTWNFHCHVDIHNSRGMNSKYTVEGAGEAPGFETRLHYFIRAEEVAWDYKPSGGPSETIDPPRVGTKYVKVRYIEYEDDTYTNQVEVEEEDSHKGILGPILRARVGDQLVIHFHNGVKDGGNCYSVHPHAVFYEVESEGVSNPPGGICPGQNHTYFWTVPERAGPAENDGSSVVWLYHSHISTRADVNSGLLGAMIITGKDQDSDGDRRPDDVDREIVTFWHIFNENVSPFLQQSLEDSTGITTLPTDEGFQESNLLYAINGYVSNNVPNLTISKGERVRWYVASSGDEIDVHTAHWHAIPVEEHGHRRDVLSLLPAQMLEADMVPDVCGVWNFHCHVNEHNSAGMNTKYTVTCSGSTLTFSWVLVALCVMWKVWW